MVEIFKFFMIFCMIVKGERGHHLIMGAYWGNIFYELGDFIGIKHFLGVFE